MNTTLLGSIVAHNSSATSVLLNCPEGYNNTKACLWNNITVTYGPWAAALGAQNPAAINAPATGNYDLLVVENYYSPPFTFSLHCDITSTTSLTACTTVNQGGDNAGQATKTLAEKELSSFALSPATVVVTGGFEKMAATSVVTTTSTIIVNNSTMTASPRPSSMSSRMSRSDMSAILLGCLLIFSFNILMR